MSKPRDGLEYLDMLRDQNSSKGGTFDDLSRYMEQQARMQGVPINGQFELTPLCNFNCRMCYAHLTPSQMNGQSLLTTNQWKELIWSAYEIGMYQATLTGGECLTYPGFEELYQFLHSLGCEITVLTNGYLINERWIQFFKEHMPAKIQITLYGHDEDSYERVTGHRSFSTVLRNLKLIREADLPLQIAITPNRYHGNDIFDTIRLAKNICGAVQINSGLFNPREETGRAGQNDEIDTDQYIRIHRLMQEIDGITVKEVPENLLPQPGGPKTVCEERGLLCGGGRSGFVIDWKGRMLPCNRLEQISAYPLKEGFRVSWDRINRAVSEWVRTAACDECPFESVCDNCAAEMLCYAAQGERPVGLCERTRKMVRYGVLQVPSCEY